ncbi:MAG: molybdopterin-dependent oxidoreductase [Actinophytocola sp.]|nr:molybdopterin-dependent oxidoreductase [Actinophytocola sp.]
MVNPTTRSERGDELPQGGDAPLPAVRRRRFLTYLVAAPALTVAAKMGLDSAASPAAEAIPSLPQLPEVYDLGDLIKLSCEPTKDMLVLEVDKDGTVRLFLPRMEVGQGITTAAAMLVAEEMDVPLSKVEIPLSDARPELIWNQLTGGSSTIRTVYEPIRNAAASARTSMVAAASKKYGLPAEELTTRDGAVIAPNGSVYPFGSLTAYAANAELPKLAVKTKSSSEFKLIGKKTDRIDARKMVTGQMEYTLDLDVPGAMPTMVRRPPTIQGSPKEILNEDEIRAMPGVIDIAMVATGVAVMAETFGQALDAKDALEVNWNPGTIDGLSNEDIKARLSAAAVPFTVPSGLTDFIDAEFDFAPVSHAPLETNTAIADVRSDRAEIWSGLKIPIIALQNIAQEVGLSEDAVTVHVVQSGGSFGRRLFHDGALEAARISKAMGKPVKLLWTRVDDMRHGRIRGASHHKVRATFASNQVLSYEHRVASVKTDWRHGFGEAITAAGAEGIGNLGYTQTIFNMTVECPYNFGAVTEVINEPENVILNTSAWRSVYSAMTRGAEEIIVDEIAAKLGKDPYEFRREFLKTDEARAVLEKVAVEGKWGKNMPDGHAQGIAYHQEYRSRTACLMEMDATDPKNPRVYKATIAVDVGRPINPTGLQAQMISGMTDAIATMHRAGLHFEDGLPLEGSYSQFHYARQKNSPIDVRVFVMPPNREEPGGSGELGVPASAGAFGCAYARATGTKPRSFPINFDVDFEPFPR